MKILIKDISRLVSMDEKIGNIDNGAIIMGTDLDPDGNLQRRGLSPIIEWVGSAKKIPKGKYKEISANNGLLTPGLIDCHTHIVHAGSRENEFAMRASGATYQDIALAGGGIMSTVNATRNASKNELYGLAVERLNEARLFGTTFAEIKTGYGLSLESEEKILKVIDKLYNSNHSVIATFLGAHVIPKEFKTKRKKYLELLLTKMIPMVSRYKICRFVDIFVEDGAFTKEEAVVIAKMARKFDLGIKLHVDQFTNIDGARLASELSAVSADHLDKSSDSGLRLMAKKGVVGVLLPGASMFMKEKLPNARKMIDMGVVTAISTDYNPGTSPVLNLIQMASLGVTQMGMTVHEAWQAITINSARALKLDKIIGSISLGKRADFTVFKADNENLPFYKYANNLVRCVFIKGKQIEC